LNTAQENPVCAQTGATGNAIATYDPATSQFCYALSYTGLSSLPEKFSHIHAPGQIGVNGPVLFTLPTTPNKMGCVTVTEEQEDSLLANLWYFNIHSTPACESGELRGQIIKI
jgi:CHRD domain